MRVFVCVDTHSGVVQGIFIYFTVVIEYTHFQIPCDEYHIQFCALRQVFFCPRGAETGPVLLCLSLVAFTGWAD